MRILLVAASMIAVALAGCADGDGPAGPVDRETFEIGTGTGAIAGLLVDDRFRPIELTEGPGTNEFQAQGFVLLQETGEQALTNENGEFTFVDLAPGTYTVRVTAAGHEAIPQRVSVSEGVFNEASVVARRVVGVDGGVVTQEFAVFIPCSIWYVANGMVNDCTFDQSGDSMRAFYFANHSALPDVSVMITEMRANRADDYAVQVRSFGPTEYYAVAVVEDEPYLKITTRIGELDEQWTEPGFENTPWENNREFQTIMFSMGDQHKTFSNAGIPGVCCGYGVKMGTKAQFIQTVFLGVPEVDIESYCVIC